MFDQSSLMNTQQVSYYHIVKYAATYCMAGKFDGNKI